jgi:YesN/AraC family two-component response regulator
MFELVITDQTMPDMTGMELAGQIRNVRTDIPVILCKGFSRTVNKEQAMQAGIRELIFKPILERKIAEALNKDTWQSIVILKGE